MKLPRKYVQWINKTSGYHASFEPEKVIRLGDFGHVDKKTGQFISEGNLFERRGGQAIADDLELGIEECPEPIFHEVHSETSHVVQTSPSVGGAMIAGSATVDAQFDIAFSRSGGAALYSRMENFGISDMKVVSERVDSAFYSRRRQS